MDTSYLFDMPSLYISRLLIVFYPLSIWVTFFCDSCHFPLHFSTYCQFMYNPCLQVCVFTCVLKWIKWCFLAWSYNSIIMSFNWTEFIQHIIEEHGCNTLLQFSVRLSDHSSVLFSTILDDYNTKHQKQTFCEFSFPFVLSLCVSETLKALKYHLNSGQGFFWCSIWLNEGIQLM